MSTVFDIIEPLAVNGKLAAWVKQSIYCTGSEIVLSDDGVKGLSLSATPLPSGATQATLNLKDTEGFAIKNLNYDQTGTLTSEQLPICTTKMGRVIVNSPGALADTDARIADHQLIVFGSMYSQHIRAQTLTVENITSLNFRFVRSLDVDEQNRVVVTTEDGSASVLPLTWQMITGKPPLESITQYLRDRVVVMQYNIDFLLNENARVSAHLESLRRLSPGDPDAPATLINQTAVRDRILTEIMAVRDSVRVSL